MAEIEIKEKNKAEDGWVFDVVVQEEGSKTEHEVFLDKKYWLKLSKEKFRPEELIEKSFEFLLEREPKEAILTSFNLKVIEKYFPEYKSRL